MPAGVGITHSAWDEAPSQLCQRVGKTLQRGAPLPHARHGQAAWGSVEPRSLLLPGQGDDLLTCEGLGGRLGCKPWLLVSQEEGAWKGGG